VLGERSGVATLVSRLLGNIPKESGIKKLALGQMI
jgi:hypothetical protein